MERAIEQRAVCPENDELVDYMRKWWIELSMKPKGYTENIEKTLKKAFTNVCQCKTPIKTLKEFKNIKGIGKWLLKQMGEFFDSNSSALDDDDLLREGKKDKGTRRYLPQKNTAAYALLITLYREHQKGTEFMRKQELIDAAEASGLARVSIAPEKGSGKPGLPGSSKNQWYSGWNSMSKLVDKGLVVKTSCPAKYKLAPAGHEVAYECLLRSDMLDSAPKAMRSEPLFDSDSEEMDVLECISVSAAKKVGCHSVYLKTKEGVRDDVRVDCVERAVVRSDSANSSDTSTSYGSVEGQQNVNGRKQSTFFRSSTALEMSVASVRPCISSGYHVEKIKHLGFPSSQKFIRMPLLGFMEKFDETYEVILILDDREHFVRSKRKNLIENICSQYKIKIEVRRLPVGDGIWIARHRKHFTEYILDFIVERKNVDDLRCSIRDNRYKDQKLRLLRTGIQKIIYLVEGDPNVCEAADTIKTACFTTEILEGFDVQRTSGLADTLKRYGYLTLTITEYYKLRSSDDAHRSYSTSPTFKEFIKKCDDLDKMTVSDVFATQLMQVPYVTEEVAVAVLDYYPTLYSLVCAYSLLDGDTCAQEEMLMKKSNNVINAAASRNIFRVVWHNE